MKFISLLFGLALILNVAQAQVFIDEAATMGISHSQEPRGLMGGGVAFFDMDNDGDDDIYLTGGYNGDSVYRNEGNGNFTNITASLNLTTTIQNYTTGVATGDIDNDGNRDIFVTTWADNSDIITNCILYLNNGNGSFSDISSQAGITHNAFSIGANFLDYNRDGFLDIYVINHVEQPAFLYDDYGAIVGFDHDCYPNFLYKNNGDNTFTEVANELGTDSDGCGLASIPSDFDFDGDLDIMIANDFGPFLTPNELFENNYPQDNFTEIASSAGAAIPMYGMGIAAGDYDHDQDLDYYITNLGANVLLENDAGSFQDVAASAQVENTLANGSDFSTGWGTAFLDVNNDSWEDLYVANGRIPSLPSLPTAFDDPNKLYLNNGDKTFTDISVDAAVATGDYCRGMAYSDFDQDGDLDIFVVSLNELGGTSKFYVNQSDNDNHFIQFNLVGTESNRDGYGSKVWVYAENQTFVKELYGGGASHVSQHTSVMHFGLGSIETVDSVKVEWTNGQVDLIGPLAIDELHVIEEGITSGIENQIGNSNFAISVFPNPFRDRIQIQTNRSFKDLITIELYTLTGLLILKKEIRPSDNLSFSLSQELSAGTYLLSIQTELGKHTQRIIKL